MDPFLPLFRNPHWETIAGRFWPRPSGFPAHETLYSTEPGVQVKVQTQCPACEPKGALLLVHGLEGSSAAGYMRSLSRRALDCGYTAHRFNLRSCGGTENLANTGYHGGLTTDLLAVLRQLVAERSRPLWLVRFSLGGNLVCKLAGELGNDASRWIAGVCAASPAIDLGACARRIGEPDNRLYEYGFVRNMRKRARVMGRLPRHALNDIRTVIELDERITAPAFGFRGAEHYYTTQSANRFLGAIRVPTLIIAAKDDTFVPSSIYDHAAIQSNPHIQLVLTEHGGHLGFIARNRPRLWLDYAIMDWIQQKGT
ncbi:MAG: alpha/beta fold hydrolase [Bryobacteraceae bacterium]